jgi:hypothetical protein
MVQEQEFITALVFSRQWQIDGLEMIFTKTEYDEETESNQDVILVTFDYTGEAEEFGGEEAFVIPVNGIEFIYTFDDDEEGWIAGFADLPADYDEDLYELDYEWSELPDDLEGHGIYMQGHNRSDDLFMFLKRQVDGLKPETAYQVTFVIKLATNVPAGLVGIGGSPGESVFVKAGATAIEPLVEDDASGHLRMNIDKGNQGGEGKDMINLGDIAHPELGESAGEEYKIKTLDSAGRSFEVITDADGSLWLVVGTDSGFEGLTALYYSQISITLIEAN